MNKKDFRKHQSELRDNIPLDVKSRWDAILCKRLNDRIKDTDIVHTYLPFRSEPNLLPLIENIVARGIVVVCPQTLPSGQMKNLILNTNIDIEYGLYNTPYPSGDNEYKGTYDVVIVPGLAFDLKGYRLGYGGGYYDRFLASHDSALKIAPCYPFQLIDELENEAHDIPVNEVIISQ